MAVSIKSIYFGRIVERQSSMEEVIAETTEAPPIWLLKRATLTKRRFIRVRGKNPKIYEFTKEEDQAQGVADIPAAAKDWDESTYEEVGSFSSSTETDLWSADLGVLKEWYALIIFGGVSDDGNSTIRLYVSEDGSTWELVAEYSTSTTVGSKTVIIKKSFRYIKITGVTSYTAYTHHAYLYEVNLFSPDKVSKKTEGDGYTVIEHSVKNLGGTPIFVIIDGDSDIIYYVYDLNDIKVTVTEKVVGMS